MKVKIKGSEVFVDDELVHAYEIAAGRFNDKVAKFLLETEGYDIDKLTDKDMESKLADVMLEEVKTMEYLSRQEVREELIATIRGWEEDED